MDDLGRNAGAEVRPSVYDPVENSSITFDDAYRDKPMLVAFTMSKHSAITDKALSPKGSWQFDAISKVKEGNRDQDADSSTRNLQTHHFDNNDLQGSLGYLQENLYKINKTLAGPPLTETDELNVLTAFGQRLHTLQDFYAHSNYVELQLLANPKLKPQDIPLMNWADIPEGKAGQVHTGFTVKNESIRFTLTREDVINGLDQQGMKIPGTDYLSTDNYKGLSSFSARLNFFTDSRYSFLHRDLNKDDGVSDEGKVVNPNTGARLYDYASNLGIRETQRQWSNFENTVRQLYGDTEGNKLLERLKTVKLPRQDNNNGG